MSSCYHKAKVFLAGFQQLLLLFCSITFCVWVFCLHVWFVLHLSKNQKRELGLLELESQRVASHHAGTEHHIWVLWEISQCSSPSLQSPGSLFRQFQNCSFFLQSSQELLTFPSTSLTARDRNPTQLRLSRSGESL